MERPNIGRSYIGSKYRGKNASVDEFVEQGVERVDTKLKEISIIGLRGFQTQGYYLLVHTLGC